MHSSKLKLLTFYNPLQELKSDAWKVHIEQV